MKPTFSNIRPEIEIQRENVGGVSPYRDMRPTGVEVRFRAEVDAEPYFYGEYSITLRGREVRRLRTVNWRTKKPFIEFADDDEIEFLVKVCYFTEDLGKAEGEPGRFEVELRPAGVPKVKPAAAAAT